MGFLHPQVVGMWKTWVWAFALMHNEPPSETFTTSYLYCWRGCLHYILMKVWNYVSNHFGVILENAVIWLYPGNVRRGISICVTLQFNVVAYFQWDRVRCPGLHDRRRHWNKLKEIRFCLKDEVYFYSKSKELQSQDFSEALTPEVEVPTYLANFFAENCMKIKEIGPREGAF